MWGFGWLKGKQTNNSTDELSELSKVDNDHLSHSQSSSSQVLLEDLPPKFEDNVQESQKKAKRIEGPKPDIFQKAVSSISTDDFKNVHTIPCFRQGMLAGLGVGGVIFAILVSTRSSISRGLNWGMGGFVVGSVASWEQCRSKMRQSKRNAQAVRESLRKPRGEVISGRSSTSTDDDNGKSS